MNKDRAKIFSSFNPLSTLEKALKAQEREKSEKLDLDESNIEDPKQNKQTKARRQGKNHIP